MYLHQNNNLSNGLTLSSNHSLNSLNMSDLHGDAFLSHPHLTTSHHLNSHSAGAAISTSPKSASAHRHFDEQNAENYLEPHYDDYGHRKLAGDEDPYELASADNLPGTESATIIKHSLSCSPSISSASSTTLNNITNFSNFISNSNLNKQLNQLADQTKTDGGIDCSRDTSKLFSSDKFDGDQNEFVSMDPLTRFLSLHPKYLELFDRFYNFLFNGDGPLRYPVRHYIAIMAAARHHCKYLVNDQQEQFKKVGGDVKWLQNIKYAPKKIQNLSEINKILAHQPWTLTKDHIERLTKGEDNWSLSELVQAIVIMAQFHTLASFVFGCGFNDADLQWSTKANLTIGSNYNSNNISDLLLTRTHISSAPPSPPSPNSLNGLLIETNLNKASESGELADSGVDTQLGDSMDTNSLESSSLNSTKVAGNPAAESPANSQSAKAGGKPANVANTLNSLYPAQQGQQANSLEILMRKMQNISEQKQQFELDNQEELVKNQSLEIHLTSTQTLTTESSFANHSPTGSNANVALSAGCTNSSPGLLPSLEDDQQDELGRFVFDTKFCYADFARQRARTDAVTTFKVQDYSWSDHAFSLVNRLYSDVGNMLDEKFTTIYNLTYWTMGRKTNVDTRLFRRAIWNYIQCMYGIRHDDYNYHQINLLLERQLKTYIKTVCCFPHQCRRKDCDTVMAEFRRSEKIHVNIMIAEARLQAELLYALRTISRYMT